MRERRRGRLPAIAATVLLSGCAGASSEGGSIARPELVDYPPAFQARAAAELERLGPGCALHVGAAEGAGCSALVRMIEDYGELRARVGKGPLE